MTDPTDLREYNSFYRLFELWKQLSGEDLLNSAHEKEGKREKK
jgi:hypothetical protein